MGGNRQIHKQSQKVLIPSQNKQTKANEDVEGQNILQQALDLIGISRTLHPAAAAAAERKFLANVRRTCAKIGYVLSHRTGLNKL